jgi:hypothetical protein
MREEQCYTYKCNQGEPTDLRGSGEIIATKNIHLFTFAKLWEKLKETLTQFMASGGID